MPSPNQVHVNTPMTEIALARTRSADMIANSLFPVVPVNKRSDLVYAIDPEDEAIRIGDTTRAPSGEPTPVDFNINADTTYLAKDHSLLGYVSDEERANADVAVQPEINRTNFLMKKIMTEKEKDAKTILDAALTGGKTSSPGTKWDAAAGTPIADIKAKISQIELESGITPNSLGMDIAVLRAISENDEFIDRAKHTLTPGEVQSLGTARILAQLLQLDNVFIARNAMENTAAKDATPVYSRIWSDTVILGATGRPSLETNVLGATMAWAGAQGPQNQDGVIVQSFRNDLRSSDALVVHYYYDQKPLWEDIDTDRIPGHRFTDVLAAF